METLSTIWKTTQNEKKGKLKHEKFWTKTILRSIFFSLREGFGFLKQSYDEHKWNHHLRIIINEPRISSVKDDIENVTILWTPTYAPILPNPSSLPKKIFQKPSVIQTFATTTYPYLYRSLLESFFHGVSFSIRIFILHFDMNINRQKVEAKTQHNKFFIQSRVKKVLNCVIFFKKGARSVKKREHDMNRPLKYLQTLSANPHCTVKRNEHF